jgi:hypothetical protein
MPESEALYAGIESAFGAARLDSLYRWLAKFHPALAGADGS